MQVMSLVKGIMNDIIQVTDALKIISLEYTVI